MNAQTNQSFPSNKTLVALSELTSKTITASINRLEAAGYFTIKREMGNRIFILLIVISNLRSSLMTS